MLPAEQSPTPLTTSFRVALWLAGGGGCTAPRREACRACRRRRLFHLLPLSPCLTSRLMIFPWASSYLLDMEAGPQDSWFWMPPRCRDQGALTFQARDAPELWDG